MLVFEIRKLCNFHVLYFLALHITLILSYILYLQFYLMLTNHFHMIFSFFTYYLILLLNSLNLTYLRNMLVLQISKLCNFQFIF